MDLDPPPNYTVDDPVPQRSCPTVDEVLAKAQFLSPLLYQIHTFQLSYDTFFILTRYYILDIFS